MTTSLDRFRVDPDAPQPVVRKGRGSEKTWVPPQRHEFANGYVLAWDQSITAAGWVVVINHPERGFDIRQAESFGESAKDGEKGWEGTLVRALRIYDHMSSVLGQWPPTSGRPTLVHEAPPTGGGKMARPESSVLGAFGLRIAAQEHGYEIAPMVTPQTHKRLICGNGNAKKPVEHAALKELVARCDITGYEKVTNEAKRDALCVGLAYLLRSQS